MFMGFRVRGRIKVCKGVYINVGKKGITSVSGKVGGVTINKNRKGRVKATTRVCKGVSYEKTIKQDKTTKPQQTTHTTMSTHNTTHNTLNIFYMFMFLFIFGMIKIIIDVIINIIKVIAMFTINNIVPISIVFTVLFVLAIIGKIIEKKSIDVENIKDFTQYKHTKKILLLTTFILPFVFFISVLNDWMIIGITSALLFLVSIFLLIIYICKKIASVCKYIYVKNKRH